MWLLLQDAAATKLDTIEANVAKLAEAVAIMAESNPKALTETIVKINKAVEERVKALKDEVVSGELLLSKAIKNPMRKLKLVSVALSREPVTDYMDEPEWRESQGYYIY